MWRIIDTMQEFIDRQTGVRSIMCEIAADTAADLPANSADRVFILGTFATAIDTGDIYKINSAGAWILQPSTNAFSNVYTTDEIDTMITTIYQYMMYYHTKQESSDGTITFYSFAGFVGRIDIYGNGQQTGTPTPATPIMPDFCGLLDDVDWTIPITCGGETTPVYLGQVQTVRKIRKLVLDGTEAWEMQIGLQIGYFRLANMPATASKVICTHYRSPDENIAYGTTAVGIKMQQSASYGVILACRPSLNEISLSDFKSYLAEQYAAGNPVTVWYVLAETTTEIVNEPLCRIGTYADELNLTKDDIPIPTVSGENTLTVDTTLQPSKIIISGD